MKNAMSIVLLGLGVKQMDIGTIEVGSRVAKLVAGK